LARIGQILRSFRRRFLLQRRREDSLNVFLRIHTVVSCFHRSSSANPAAAATSVPLLIHAPFAGISLHRISKDFVAADFAEQSGPRPSGQRASYHSLFSICPWRGVNRKNVLRHHFNRCRISCQPSPYREEPRRRKKDPGNCDFQAARRCAMKRRAWQTRSLWRRWRREARRTEVLEVKR